MKFVDVLLLIVSIVLIALIVLQKSDEDAANAFTGEKSDLYSNKKERGWDVLVQYLTAGFSIAFFVLAIVAQFLVSRFSI